MLSSSWQNIKTAAIRINIHHHQLLYAAPGAIHEFVLEVVVDKILTFGVCGDCSQSLHRSGQQAVTACTAEALPSVTEFTAAPSEPKATETRFASNTVNAVCYLSIEADREVILPKTYIDSIAAGRSAIWTKSLVYILAQLFRHFFVLHTNRMRARCFQLMVVIQWPVRSHNDSPLIQMNRLSINDQPDVIDNIAYSPQL
mmetsp:Transcript_55844/g.86786  ORF Transcript_55844/g.86786 Transcript_55844/m.86786 type:complete len:200 (-) Transcript_55844:777-1376(-)